MRFLTLLREAVRTAAAQRVSSVLIAVVCAATCAVTLLTVGRTAATEAQVLSRLDTAGARLLVVTDARGAGLITPATVRVLDGLDSTERVVGVGTPFDVFNATIGAGAARTPAWSVTGKLAHAVTLAVGRWPRTGEALVAQTAIPTLGLAHPAGAVADSTGRQYDIVGAYTARAPFRDFDAGVIIAGDRTSPIHSAHVVVTSVSTARETEALVVSTLASGDLRALTVQSPTALADLQRAVTGDLGRFGRGILVFVLGGGAFLTAAIVLAEVLLRRRGLGRRRALGISRHDLVILLVARTAAAAVPGAALGVAGGAAVVAAWAATPPMSFAVGVMVLTSLSATGAAVPPALLAANRDPIGVLRTP